MQNRVSAPDSSGSGSPSKYLANPSPLATSSAPSTAAAGSKVESQTQFSLVALEVDEIEWMRIVDSGPEHLGVPRKRQPCLLGGISRCATDRFGPSTLACLIPAPLVTVPAVEASRPIAPPAASSASRSRRSASPGSPGLIRRRSPRVGTEERAIEDYDQAIRLNPNFAPTYNQPGQYLQWQGPIRPLHCGPRPGWPPVNPSASRSHRNGALGQSGGTAPAVLTEIGARSPALR
jgi:hypothetical protein